MDDEEEDDQEKRGEGRRKRKSGAVVCVRGESRSTAQLGIIARLNLAYRMLTECNRSRLALLKLPLALSLAGTIVAS